MTDSATGAESSPSPDPGKSQVEAFYDRFASVYDPPMTRRHFLEDDRYGNLVAKVAQGPRGQKILDTACGNGWLASLYRADHEVIGVDIVDGNLARMEALGIRAIKHNLEDSLPFADAEFDTVVCSEILEHLFQPELLLVEVLRVLKPGGRIILTVPNLHALRNRVEMLVGKRTPFIEFRIYDDPKDQISHVGVQHIRHYTISGMCGILKRLGFEQIESAGQSFHLNSVTAFEWLGFLHGGNRGLRLLLRGVSFGRWRPEFPGLVLRLALIRMLAWCFPRLAAGMIVVARRPAGAAHQSTP